MRPKLSTDFKDFSRDSHFLNCDSWISQGSLKDILRISKESLGSQSQGSLKDLSRISQ